MNMDGPVPRPEALDRRLRSRFVSIATLVGAIALAPAAPALAKCSNHNPVAGETVTCDTNQPNPDPQGIVGEDANVTVNILSGAAIEDPFIGINMIDTASGADRNWTVDNSGSVSGAALGIRVLSGDIVNRIGAGISGGTGIGLLLSLDPETAIGTIVNAGTISGTSDEAIEAGGTAEQVIDLTLEGTSVLNGDVFVQSGSAIVRLNGDNAEDSDFGLFTDNVVDFVVADSASWTLSGMLDVLPVRVNTVGSGRLTISGVVTSFGELSKIGTGTLTLTGDNTYQGATSVEDGVLRVDGSIANSTVTVSADGRLEGTGIVGATTNNGTVAPGNSIGVLTVSGNYTHTGTLEVEIEPGGGADVLDISGAANITGGTVAVSLVPGSYAPGTRFPILRAESVTGAFDNLTQDNPGIPLELAQEGNTIFLVVPAPVLTFEPASLDFGGVQVTATSSPETSTLRNTGGSAATLDFSTLENGFSADTSGCGPSLAAGASCPISVTFSPTAIGGAEGTLTVQSEEGATTTLGLSGTGVAFRYDFAEGATGYFTTTLGLFNPDRAASANVQVRLLPEGGQPIVLPITLPPFGRRSVDVNAALGATATGVAAVVTSDRPIAPIRQMSWDDTTFGSTLESGAPGPSTTHYFAEGATTLWDLFYLLANDNDAPAQVTIQYLRDAGTPVVQEVTVPAHARQTVWVNAVPGMADAQAGAIITSDVPIAAERSMYLTAGEAPWSAGASSRGAHAPDDTWYFAEGATDFFDDFLLLMNPDATAPATVEVHYHLTDGQTITKRHVVPAQSRRTILVEAEDARLADQLMASMTVSAAGPIVAERAMWWGPDAASWYESMASVGSSEPGTVWAIGEAWTGGPMAEDAFVLLANAASEAGQVRVTMAYDDGTTEAREIALAASARMTLLLSELFPASAGRRFSVLVESLGDAPVPIIVDVSRYQSTGGRFGNAGGSTTATRIR